MNKLSRIAVGVAVTATPGVPANATALNCTYDFQQSQTDPRTGDVFTFTGSGTVTGFIPAASC